MSLSPKRTLVVHVGGIGDFLLMCPVLPHLAKDGPVDVVGQLDRVRLAVAGGLAEAAYSVDAIGFDTLFETPSERLKQFIGGYDRAVVWMRDDGAIARRMRAAGIHEVFVFPGLPPSGWARHASEYYATCLGVDTRAPLRLAPAPSETAYDIVIHCGSGGQKKNWPFSNFVAIGQHLEMLGRRPTWLLGPAEEDIRLPSDAATLRLEALTEVARALASARLYIGNDSGITHLAAAVGRPTVAIFGPTNPAFWAPRGEHVHIVGGRPWPTVEEVSKVVREALRDSGE